MYICIYVHMYVYVACMCRYVYVCVCANLMRMCVVLFCTPLRKRPSLSLELDWQSASPRDTTVSTSHRAQLIGLPGVCSHGHAWPFYADAKIRIQDLFCAESVPMWSHPFSPCNAYLKTILTEAFLRRMMFLSNVWLIR